MGNYLRKKSGMGELADFQGQSFVTTGMALFSVQEGKEAWQKASMAEHRASV